MDGHIFRLIPTELIAFFMHFSYALYKLDLKYLNMCSYVACMCVREHSTTQEADLHFLLPICHILSFLYLSVL